MLPAPLLVITDRAQSRLPLPLQVEGLLAGGCRWLLLREAGLPQPELLALGTRLRDACRHAGAAFYVSRDAELAQLLQADGLHLAATQSLPEARQRFTGPLGQSCHNAMEARQAAAAGARYVTLSPAFASASKPGYGPALGAAGLQGIARDLALPALALGGLAPATLPACRAAGAAGGAVMGGAMRAADPRQFMQACLAGWHGAVRAA